MTIAFFDSGIGGLTVLYEAMRRMPDERFLYYADTLHVPYGVKPKEQVKEYILTAVQSIMSEEPVSALVVACNTATSIAIRDLRSRYDIPIVGMEPAVKPAVERNRSDGKRVLVAATPLTLQEAKYHELVNRVDNNSTSIVDSLPMPELVDYCEQLIFEGEEVSEYIRARLSPFPLSDYGTVVLGCTHFPFYRNLLLNMLPRHVSVIDGSAGTVRRLQKLLPPDRSPEPSADRGSLRLLCSGDSREYVRKMERALLWFGGQSDSAR